MAVEYLIHSATLDDVPYIIEHRCAMFHAMGDSSETIATMTVHFPNWVTTHLQNKQYRQWFAECADGKIIGGVGLWLPYHIPKPLASDGFAAHMVNVYVNPSYRRQGIARKFVTHIIAWCRDAGLPQITLETSQIVQPLYESLGFVIDNHMVLRFVD